MLKRLALRLPLSVRPVHQFRPIQRQSLSNCSGESCTCKCQKCGQHLGQCSLFCTSPSCGFIQKLDLYKCNHFELFGLPFKYDLEPAAIDVAFKKLQWVLHPDKFSTKESEQQLISTHNSSIVNDAYAILKSPIERAVYVMSLMGVKPFDDYKAKSNSMMMEMFSLREEAEELSEVSEIIERKKQLQQDCLGLQTDIGDNINSHIETAVAALIRLKYLNKIVEELDGKL